MAGSSTADEGNNKQGREKTAWFTLSVGEVLDRLNAESDGLTEEEASTRLERYGKNTIQSDQKVSPWTVLIHQFKSPLVYVLFATLAIQSYGDAIVIGLVLLVNGTIGFIQEYKAETAVQSLMQMVSPKAQVRRNGEEQTVDSTVLVPGDCVLLKEGTMVPADIRLREAASLQID